MSEFSNTKEINDALKEFEAKASAEQMPQSPTVATFDDVPKIVRWVMKLSGGAIKERKQAEYVLFGLVVLAIIISLFLFFGLPSVGTGPKVDQALIDQMMQVAPKK